MPAVAKAIISDLSALAPAHAAYFQENATKFEEALKPWYPAIAKFKAAYPNTPVATTEPVGDYMLEASRDEEHDAVRAAGGHHERHRPGASECDATKNSLFSGHKVKVFVYNQQVTDSLTASFRKAALTDGIPVVGVYETMPVPGYDYQSWMLAEVKALERAVGQGKSTEKL